VPGRTVTASSGPADTVAYSLRSWFLVHRSSYIVSGLVLFPCLLPISLYPYSHPFSSPAASASVFPGTDIGATKARKTRNEWVQNAKSPFHSVFVSLRPRSGHASWPSISESGSWEAHLAESGHSEDSFYRTSYIVHRSCWRRFSCRTSLWRCSRPFNRAGGTGSESLCLYPVCSLPITSLTASGRSGARSGCCLEPRRCRGGKVKAEVEAKMRTEDGGGRMEERGLRKEEGGLRKDRERRRLR